MIEVEIWDQIIIAVESLTRQRQRDLDENIKADLEFNLEIFKKLKDKYLTKTQDVNADQKAVQAIISRALTSIQAMHDQITGQLEMLFEKLAETKKDSEPDDFTKIINRIDDFLTSHEETYKQELEQIKKI